MSAYLTATGATVTDLSSSQVDSNPVQTHDLRALFRAVGAGNATRALTSVEKRTQTDVPVELLEVRSALVQVEPCDASAFVDGVQASLLLTYRDHRPVHLNFFAAAAVSRTGRPVAISERLELVVAARDAEWAHGLNSSVPVHVLAEVDPSETERLALAGLAGGRETLERLLIDELLDQDMSCVLDGSLLGRPADRRLLGVVKTTRRRYLTDEQVLWSLQPGWRSPIFRIPAGSQGCQADRYSCYLRLVDATSGSWDLGLIRLESFDPDALEPLAALCLEERQNSRSGDGRWDRHIRPIRVCEELLRARRPAVYNR